jgi:hypothetical protein
VPVDTPTPAASHEDPELTTLLASLQIGEPPTTPARTRSAVYQYDSPQRSGITTEWYELIPISKMHHVYLSVPGL